jgi:hypothetical protein
MRATTRRRRLTVVAIVTLMMAAASSSAIACVGSATRASSGVENGMIHLEDRSSDRGSAAVHLGNSRRDTVPRDAVTLARGEDADGRSFRIFTFPTDGRRGIGLKYHHDVETRCCVTRMRGVLRPVGFLVGTVIAFASRDVRHSAYFPYQLAPKGKVRGFLYPSRHTALRVSRVILVFDDLNGMDGDLVAYDVDREEIARRYVGLPPVCASPRHRFCFA